MFSGTVFLGQSISNNVNGLSCMVGPLQTWVWLRVKSWVGSESDAFCFSHELIWIEKWAKHFESWVNLNQCLRNPLGSMSWFWVNSWKGDWVMSWFESWHWLNVQKGQWNLVIAQKSMKLNKNPEKINNIEWKSKRNVDKINAWFELLSHDLIRLDFWVISWFNQK